MKPLSNQDDDELGRSLRQAVHALPDAPPAWQDAAVALWPGAAAAFKTAVVETLRRVVAVLSFDSWAQPAVAHGMRSVKAPTRHLLFSAEGRDVDLRIAPAERAFALSGQILGPDEAGTIELAAVGREAPARSAELDALGEFRIDDLARGRYLVTLRMGADEIVLPEFEVGDGGGDARP